MTQAFSRHKPHLNLALLGLQEADRQQFQRRLCGAARRYMPHEGPTQRRYGWPALEELETPTRHFALSCNPGTLPNQACQMSGVDAAIVLIAADTPPEHSYAALLMAHHMGVTHLVMVIQHAPGKADAMHDDLLEGALKAQLDTYHHPAGQVPFIHLYDDSFTALCAVLDACDQLPLPERDLNGTLAMPIQHIASGSNHVTVSGCICRGAISEGHIVELIGSRGVQQAFCTAVGSFDKVLAEGQAGDQATVFLSGLNLTDVYPGQVLSQLGNLSCCNRLIADVYLPLPEEGGDGLGVISGDRLSVCIGNNLVEGTLDLPPEWQSALPGSRIELTITLECPTVTERGDGLLAFDDQRLILAGKVAYLLS
ncbi:translation elongation factor EF-Tu-like GTPase [Chitinivorax tropicus]|uniref:Translation elongation factor EF-Tu-like GTPase n=1 Tax=Chitinivorax tropicus TaxID=714531 RepID=A0A840MER3_9PROT|nr:hypothetical protein [Chitinivorax tropicus]MBB5017754.1 translation elongation factor EF-Tu-like GTPase [Chitinivorax tropicus]